MINLRTAAGLSQQAVAEKLHLARATYANLEAGRRVPNLTELTALAELYQVSITDLIEGAPPASAEAVAEIQLAPVGAIEQRKTIKAQPEKIREVLLYILNKIGAKPNVGETVLYKLLYFIDFDYFEQHGQSLTGLSYVRNHFGPTPKAQTFKGVIEAMQRAEQLEVVETKYFNHWQRKYLPVVPSTLHHLTAQEIKHIDDELARLGDKSAAELTDLSHQDTPWIVTKENQPIDYQFAMYRSALTSVREFEDEL